MTTLIRERPLIAKAIHEKRTFVHAERDRAVREFTQAQIDAARAELRDDPKHRPGLIGGASRIAMLDALLAGLARLAKVAERHELAEQVADGDRRIEAARITAYDAREAFEAALRRETNELAIDTRSTAERVGRSPEFERLRSELAAEVEAACEAQRTTAAAYNRTMHAVGEDSDRLAAVDAADPSLVEETL